MSSGSGQPSSRPSTTTDPWACRPSLSYLDRLSFGCCTILLYGGAGNTRDDSVRLHTLHTLSRQRTLSRDETNEMNNLTSLLQDAADSRAHIDELENAVVPRLMELLRTLFQKKILIRFRDAWTDSIVKFVAAQILPRQPPRTQHYIKYRNPFDQNDTRLLDRTDFDNSAKRRFQGLDPDEEAALRQKAVDCDRLTEELEAVKLQLRNVKRKLDTTETQLGMAQNDYQRAIQNRKSIANDSRAFRFQEDSDATDPFTTDDRDAHYEQGKADGKKEMAKALEEVEKLKALVAALKEQQDRLDKDLQQLNDERISLKKQTKYSDDLKANLEDMFRAYDKLLLEKTELEKQLDGATQSRSAAQSQCEELEKQVQDQQAQLEKEKTATATLESERNKLKEELVARIDEAQVSTLDLKSKLTAAEGSASEAQTRCGTLEKQVQDQQAQLEKEKTATATLESERNKLKEELVARIDEAQVSTLDLKSKLTAAEGSASEAQTRCGTLEKQVQDQQAQLEKEKTATATLESERNKLKEELVARINEEQVSALDLKSKLEEQVQKQKEELSELEGQLDKIKATLDAANSSAATLQTSLTQEQTLRDELQRQLTELLQISPSTTEDVLLFAGVNNSSEMSEIQDPEQLHHGAAMDETLSQRFVSPPLGPSFDDGGNTPAPVFGAGVADPQPQSWPEMLPMPSTSRSTGYLSSLEDTRARKRHKVEVESPSGGFRFVAENKYSCSSYSNAPPPKIGEFSFEFAMVQPQLTPLPVAKATPLPPPLGAPTSVPNPPPSYASWRVFYSQNRLSGFADAQCKKAGNKRTKAMKICSQCINKNIPCINPEPSPGAKAAAMPACIGCLDANKTKCTGRTENSRITLEHYPYDQQTLEAVSQLHNAAVDRGQSPGQWFGDIA
ncbi:hypothetical protein FB45DRAFT_1017858 [Roridomyces roridus]|uniref:Uncharacterized protein n=1 Tax=Roridomyces roridus TaxID=1738132 RepID=A0AAD7FYW1_9AGAR|nr:hypothetical protein FB45DRAFT_1017858 [Roridomyces roridus]